MKFNVMFNENSVFLDCENKPRHSIECKYFKNTKPNFTGDIKAFLKTKMLAYQCTVGVDRWSTPKIYKVSVKKVFLSFLLHRRFIALKIGPPHFVQQGGQK